MSRASRKTVTSAIVEHGDSQIERLQGRVVVLHRALDNARKVLASYGSAGTRHVDPVTGEPCTQLMADIVAALKG